MNRQQRRDAERRAARAASRAGRGGAGAMAAIQEAAALARAGMFADAEKIARAAVSANPSSAEALVVLSATLRGQGRHDEAVAQARRATVRDPSSAAAHTALGNALRAQDRVFESLDAFSRALDVNPDDAPAHSGMGLALVDIGELARAEPHLRRATELAPQDHSYINSYGMALTHWGRFPEAHAAFSRSLELDPGNPTVLFNQAFVLLGMGRLGEGWDLYEQGFAGAPRKPNRTFDVPRWDGSPVRDGRRLMVWREQGVGDEIRFASCYPDALERADDVIIESDWRLVELFRRSFPSATVRAQRCDPVGNPTTDEVDFDVQAPSGALPALFRRRLEDFPASNTYLVADSVRRDDFRRRLDELGGGLKVGICWRSMKLEVSRLAWYTTLQEWAPVFELDDVELVSLQYGPEGPLVSELDAHEAAGGRRPVRWEDVDYTNDLDGVAALIDALDLVVSVNTAVSAMAGALGKPVFQIGLTGDAFQLGVPDRYVWFPTMRQFSREWERPWDDTMQAVAAAVAQRRDGQTPT